RRAYPQRGRCAANSAKERASDRTRRTDARGRRTTGGQPATVDRTVSGIGAVGGPSAGHWSIDWLYTGDLQGCERRAGSDVFAAAWAPDARRYTATAARGLLGSGVPLPHRSGVESS